MNNNSSERLFTGQLPIKTGSCRYQESEDIEESEYAKFIFNTDFGAMAPKTVGALIIDFVIQLSVPHMKYCPGRQVLCDPDIEDSYADFYGYGNSNDPLDSDQVAYNLMNPLDRDDITWPEPTGININMMPFIYGDKSSLPEEYHGYWKIIQTCWAVDEVGKVCYLTIQESDVNAGETQRRPGLHIEKPGTMQQLQWEKWPNGARFHSSQEAERWKYFRMDECGAYNAQLFWGGGNWQWGKPNGGIYMASNVHGSCDLWPILIKRSNEVIWKHGDISHLKSSLKYVCDMHSNIKSTTSRGRPRRAPVAPRKMEADKLYWLTDRTPHEAVAVNYPAHRQFFRLVTSNISFWFEDHATPNRLGIELPKDVVKLSGNKFEDSLTISYVHKNTLDIENNAVDDRIKITT